MNDMHSISQNIISKNYESIENRKREKGSINKKSIKVNSTKRNLKNIKFVSNTSLELN